MDEPESCEDDLQKKSLTDLPVTDEHADSARGGAQIDQQAKLLIGTEGGLWR